MYFKNQKFLVAGISKSGAASGAFLLDRGAQVLLYDDLAADGVKKAMTELAARGARIVRAEELSAAAEAFVAAQLERGFRTLEFYKSLQPPDELSK